MGVYLICVTPCAFSHHSFLLVEKHVWPSHALELDQQNPEGRNRIADRTGPRKCCCLQLKIWWLHSTSSFLRREWPSAMVECTALCVYKSCIYKYNQKMYAVPYAVMSSIACTCRAFAGHRSACHVLIHTNGLMPENAWQLSVSSVWSQALCMRMTVSGRVFGARCHAEDYQQASIWCQAPCIKLSMGSVWCQAPCIRMTAEGVFGARHHA